jgi:hypothetical protein
MPARQELFLVSSSTAPETSGRPPASVPLPPARGRLPSSVRERLPESRRAADSGNMSGAVTDTTKALLRQAMDHAGVTGAALADWETGEVLGVAGGGVGVDMELAAAVHCEVVRAKIDALRALSPGGEIEAIEDIVVTLPSQYHVMRPLPAGAHERTEFLYVAISRATGNLALARLHLSDLTQHA